MFDAGMIKGEPLMRDTILAAAKANAKVRRVKLRTVSRECHGDSPFLDKLSRRRCSFTARKFDEVMAWFADPSHWPDGTVPDCVRDLFAPLAPK